MEEEEKKKKIDGKMKSVASIPPNYVSIIQLQERWMREKEKKGDLFVEREVNGQEGRRREETVEASVKVEEKGFIRPCGENRWKKEPNCVKKEEVEKVSVIVNNKDENGDSREKKKKRKKKKKKNVKEMVKCESKVSPAHIPRKENKNDPVKEIVAKHSTAAEEIQFQDHLWINKRVEEEEEEEGREVKGPVRLNNGQGYDRKNQRRDWSSTPVVRTTTTRTMVWVKKGRNDGSARGNGV